MKRYSEEELRKIISKKYHTMIDWESTMFQGFDGAIILVDNGQKTKTLFQSLYESVRNVNWYLKRIQENPNIQW